MLPLNIWRNLIGWVFGTVLLALVLFYGLQAIVAGSTRPVTVVVYAFSTQEEVLTQGIFPAFEQAWEAETGQDLTPKVKYSVSSRSGRWPVPRTSGTDMSGRSSYRAPGAGR